MEPLFLALTIVILLLSVIIHEVMHGVVALYFGDSTAQRAGRLTLNPIPHIDPIGTLILPAVLILTGSPVVFGWAKPVPVNPLNFTKYKQGELWTSAAGVISNFILALLAAGFFHLILSFASFPVLQILSYAAHINLILAIFNLIPVPPLDGSKILMTLLPNHLARQYMSWERYGPIILLILLLVPFGGISIVSLILGTIVGLLSKLLGV